MQLLVENIMTFIHCHVTIFLNHTGRQYTYMYFVNVTPGGLFGRVLTPILHIDVLKVTIITLFRGIPKYNYYLIINSSVCPQEF